jgi:hypothetical protein
MAGTLIDGVKQLIFATDGTAELFRVVQMMMAMHKGKTRTFLY